MGGREVLAAQIIGSISSSSEGIRVLSFKMSINELGFFVSCKYSINFLECSENWLIFRFHNTKSFLKNNVFSEGTPSEKI